MNTQETETIREVVKAARLSLQQAQQVLVTLNSMLAHTPRTEAPAPEASESATEAAVASPSATTSPAPVAEKQRATRLRARVGDKLICRDTGVDTYIEVLKQLGLERVEKLPLRLCGLPLVSTKRYGGYQSVRRVDGFYVVTHASTAAKKKILERVSQRLGTSIEIEVVNGIERDQATQGGDPCAMPGTTTRPAPVDGAGKDISENEDPATRRSRPQTGAPGCH